MYLQYTGRFKFHICTVTCNIHIHAIFTIQKVIYFASKTRAMIPEAMAADADVPLNVLSHVPSPPVVIYTRNVDQFQ